MESVRKVRVLYNDGRSGLIQIEDDFGDCWVRRGRCIWWMASTF
jgi:hypothetical protein